MIVAESYICKIADTLGLRPEVIRVSFDLPFFFVLQCDQLTKVC
jgi:hypothetical protein